MNIRSQWTSEPMQGKGFSTIEQDDSVSEQTKVADAQFKPGDTVSLRSGGPLMTIVMVDGQTAFCEWFSDDQQPQSRSFALTSLKHSEQR